MATRTRPRRGIVLLIVLSLLTLFLLMGVTFLISASQYKKGATARAKHEITGDDPRKLFDEAFYQLMRDTSMHSSIRDHGILEDLYGRDLFRGVVSAIPGPPAIAAVVPEQGGQFFRMRFAPVPGFTFAPATNYYSGRVISFYAFNTGVPVDKRPVGPISTRVVDSGIDATNNPFILIEAFELEQPLTQAELIAALNRSQLLINGQPFNGYGAGYNPGTGNLDVYERVTKSTYDPADPTTYVDAPIALLPHFSRLSPGKIPNIGGADESYDAVDFQNMYLAMVPAQFLPTRPSWQQIIPSFHRPSLANYWFAWIAANVLAPSGVVVPAEQRQIFNDPYGLDHIRNTPDEAVPPWNSVSLVDRDFIVDLKARFTLRPLPELNPNFPALDLIGGPWDVDNDNDGVPDSIWVDIGLPTFTGKNGRKVKPLVAILVKDMDGRFNVNAHSNLAQTRPDYSQRLWLIDNPGMAPDVPFPGAPSSVALPRGKGFGPTDINMSSMFLGGEFASVLSGRYGVDGVPGVPGNDLFSQYKTLGTPALYNGAAASGYASPPDVWGRGALALDFAGQPLYSFGINPPDTLSPSIDDPYELNLSGVGSDVSLAVDTPYTNGDLERLLRWNDVDAGSLPSRLAATAPTTFTFVNDVLARQRRNLVTTESRHIPVPNLQLPPERRRGMGPSPSLIDVYLQKMGGNGTFANLHKIVPLEMLHGQLFNLNRYFGDGADNAPANGVVDDPTEADTLFNPGRPINSPGFARHLFARNLYCLMMLLWDNNYRMTATGEPGLKPGELDELTIRRIAQWSINAVDFRDPDAIMSPFEYDVNPFNGWVVDGNPATNEGNDGLDNDGDMAIDEADEKERRVVWGCEFPDLMITEGMALHDRRVGDSKYDSGGTPDTRQKGGMGNNEGDTDLDQIRKPEGSVFLEFFCPRNRPLSNAGLPGPPRSNPVLPAELYDATTGGLVLTGIPANLRADGLRQPIWRVVLSKDSAADRPLVRMTSPMTPGRYSTSFEPSNMNLVRAAKVLRPDRIVWFAPLPPAGALPYADRTYYGRSGAQVLRPGHYAVVGPRPVTNIGSRTRDPAKPEKHLNSPQRIILRSDADPLTHDVKVHDAAGNDGPYLATAKKPPVAIVAAAVRPPGWNAVWNPLGIGISLTEPLPTAANYYPEPTFLYDADRAANGGNGLPLGYDHEDPMQQMITPESFPDRPLDSRLGSILRNENKLVSGWYRDYASAFLQRLANPTLPWNPQPPHPLFDGNLPVNPFITVDWSTLDLNVFNGEDRKPGGYPAALEPWDKGPGPGGVDTDLSPPDPPGPPGANIHLVTRQRGVPPNPATPDTSLWPPASTQPFLTNKAGPAENHFRYNLIHSLGFLNQTMGAPINSPGSPYHGDPNTANPFPWLTWLNRPFHNPFELMLVPTSSPARLMHEFSFLKTGPGTNPYNPLSPDSAFLPYQHLLNFWQTGDTAAIGAHFYRLFDYVETPSRFVGAERWYNPAAFAAASDHYEMPFNYLSRFRDSGKININTVFDEVVWEGIAKAYPAMDPNVVLVDPGPDQRWGAAGVDDDGANGVDDPGEAMTPGTDDVSNIDPGRDNAWGVAGVDDDGNMVIDDFAERLAPGSDDLRFVDKLALSRQGYGPNWNRNEIGSLNPTSPTRFGNPFRSAASADLVPPGCIPAPLGVDATLLRNDPLRTGKPLLVYPSGFAYQNSQRNPYFLYQGLGRLPNLLTTHSNVFAVWMTVGYFEVDRQRYPPQPPPFTTVPDGYELGRELGSETGEVNRHRAFYLIDRSIPVAYEPGENHNVDRAILIKRFIK